MEPYFSLNPAMMQEMFGDPDETEMVSEFVSNLKATGLDVSFGLYLPLYLREIIMN